MNTMLPTTVNTSSHCGHDCSKRMCGLVDSPARAGATPRRSANLWRIQSVKGSGSGSKFRQGQHELSRLAPERHEPVVNVECFRPIVLRIHNQGEDCDL